MTDAKRAEIESLFSASKKAFENLEEATRKDVFVKMRRFVKWYDFMVQAAFLDDTLLYKKRVYIDILLGHLNVGDGGTGFSLWNKVDAIGFRQEKTLETHKPKVASDPKAVMPEMDGVGDEDDEERLSKIIERLNSTYGKNLDPKIAAKGISQIITKAENDEELKSVATSNDFGNFAITFGEAATKRLIVESYEQSEEFYNLLLSNEEARETVLKAIAKRVYETLRGEVAAAVDSRPPVLTKVAAVPVLTKGGRVSPRAGSGEGDYEYDEAAEKGDSKENADDGYDASK